MGTSITARNRRRLVGAVAVAALALAGVACNDEPVDPGDTGVTTGGDTTGGTTTGGATTGGTPTTPGG